jgi:hypothetical protein
MADTFTNAIDIAELASSPANPPSGFRRLYSKSDGLLYQKTSAGVESEVTNSTITSKPSLTGVADVAFTNTAGLTPLLTIPANTLAIGSAFEFECYGSVINSITASNLLIDIMVNGVAVATTTLALGTTAFASPGRGFYANGLLVVRTIGATGSMMPHLFNSVNSIAPVSSNIVTAPAINTTANITLGLRIASSSAATTGNIRSFLIEQVK